MDNITKTKLINDLIGLVSQFYDLKQRKGALKQIKYLKGFSEGIAYTLVELHILTDKEAKNILKGLGKKRDLNEIVIPTEIASKPNIQDMPPLTKPQPKIKTEATKPLTQTLEDDLDIPTIFRNQDKKQQQNKEEVRNLKDLTF